jgi:hypothetical protein
MALSKLNGVTWGNLSKVNGVAKAGISKVNGIATTQYLLDAIGGTFVTAISTRRLRSAWTGNVRNVRRSTDSATQDVGTIGENYDAATETTFIGANTGYGRRMYDQSGSGNDWIGDSFPTYQPLTCESGTLVAGPSASRYASRHDATPRVYRNTLGTVTGAWSFVMVGIDDGSSDDTARSFFSNITTIMAFPRLVHYNNSYRLNLGCTSPSQITNNTCALGNWFVAVGVLNGANSVLRVNGSEVTGDTGTAYYNALDIGNGALIGRTCEFAMQAGVWDATTRATAEANAKAYWGITW